MKTVCIYHSIDLDGWMSAAIVKYWWNNNPNAIDNNDDKLDFIGYNYGQPIPDLSEYDKVIMCDISFPSETMYKLSYNRSEGNIEFIWLDHHISAINDFEKALTLKGDRTDYPSGERNTKFAACELTWKYFFSNPIDKFGEVEEQNPMPEIVRLLGRYDCFGHKGTDEETKVMEFQYGARNVISNYENAYTYLLYSFQDNKWQIENISKSGKFIYQYLCTEAKQTYKNGFEIILLERLTGFPNSIEYINRKFICFNKKSFNLANFGIDYHADGYDGAACFHYANGYWNFSLYNDNGKVDCSTIAKQFGGGGHKGAAGFRVIDINSFFGIKIN